MLRAHIQLDNQRAPGSGLCLVLLWIKTPVFAAQGLRFLHQQDSEVSSPASRPLLELCNLLGKF